MSRAVVVSGASKGIGRATAIALAARGWRVLAGVRRTADGDGLRAEAGDALRPIPLEVTDDESVAAAAELVDGQAPDGLAGLVNNAGTVLAGPLEAIPPDAFREQLEVNAIGVLRVTQVFLPALRRARGRIVNVSSINGRLTSPFTGAYCASKHALEAMSDAWRMELAPAGVSVVVVEPGAVATSIRESSAQRAEALFQTAPAEVHERYRGVMEALAARARTPPAGAVPPEAVARAIVRALESPRPRTRYLVGRDARVGALLARWLPDRWLDRVVGGR